MGGVSTDDVHAQEEARRSGQAKGYRKCPSCAEAIRIEAIKCRYCQGELPSTTSPSGAFTGKQYFKACSKSLEGLRQWAYSQHGVSSMTSTCPQCEPL